MLHGQGPVFIAGIASSKARPYARLKARPWISRFKAKRPGL